MVTPAEQAPRLSTKPNYLSLEPRLPHEGGPFDDDCPARFFWLTPNHNNDHPDIKHIRILPTADEILCQKRPYMPTKDAHKGTQDRRGKARMLDVQFRHLRYDTLEPVIDACYHASQHLATTFKQPLPLDYEARQRTVRGTQYSLFRDARLEDSRFENDGIHLRLSFACPTRLRERQMLSSGHFESGMLMALIGLDSENTLSTAFLKVEMCQSTFSMKPITGNHLRASVVASFAEPSDTTTMRQTLYGLKGLLNEEKFVVVEFPKVLVAGFYWILKHLQLLNGSNAEIAFSDLIASSHTPHYQQIAPPAYSEAGNSPFDLSVLQETNQSKSRHPLQLEPGFMALVPVKQEAIIEDVCSSTTLDHGQATALCESLSRGLAFTQGPPGTGKTFLGVSLAKVILKHAPQKPILVACMTNHALDNFLGDLLKQGITKIARIGSGSKEEWTNKYTMPSIRQNFGKREKGCGEQMNIDEAHASVQALWTQGTTWCEALNTCTLTWATVADHLKTKYPYMFGDFSTYESPREQKVSDIRQARSKAGGYAFEHWCFGKDLIDTEEFSRNAGSFFGKHTADVCPAETSSELKSYSIDLSLHPRHIPVSYPYDYFGESVWSMPMGVRAAWITRWKSELGESSPVDKLIEIQRRYLEAKKTKQDFLNQSDAKCLANQEVIGLTTTACAKYWPMLKSLDLQTLICEEAGEVSEAQTITTLLPSIKHAIFIGDPLQLRPQVNQPNLSLETPYGAKYRLDESLFERMVMSRASGVRPLPASKLTLQRRMHPDVAELMRATLYPFLKDHLSTSHLPVAGLAHRTFWLDHQEPEDVPNSLAVSKKSYSNAFECAMVCELVRYLLNTNDFGSGEIAILVPYSQQLACLKEKLSGTCTCSIALSEKDKEDLMDMGLLDESEQSQFKTDVEVFPMVRLATIDGFQGEEAKVIILSTVRSNLQDRVGFLQTTNRINVACSRARNGFYIVGNSTLLRTIDMVDSDAHSPPTAPGILTWRRRSLGLDNSKMWLLAMKHVATCSAVDTVAPRSVTNLFSTLGCAASNLAASDMKDVATNVTKRAASLTLYHAAIHTWSSALMWKKGKKIRESARPNWSQSPYRVDTRCNAPALPRTSLLFAAPNANSSTNVVINAAADTRNLRRTTSMAYVKGPATNNTLAVTIVRPSATLVLVRRAIYLASNLVSMVGYAEDLVESSATHVSSHARRLPVSMGIAPPSVRYHVVGCLAARLARMFCLARISVRGFAENAVPACVCNARKGLCLRKLRFSFLAATISTLQNSTFSSGLCPECGALCDSVPRYRHVRQFQLAPDTLERLCKMFGRKMHIFAENIRDYRKNLQKGLKWFYDNFEPGPLTGKANAAMIKARMLFIIPVETAITRFRDDVMVRVENDMAYTALLLGKKYLFVPISLSFKLRLDLLHLHCRLTVLQEAARIVLFLREFDNPRHTEHMAKTLEMHTIQEVDENVVEAEKLAEQCRSNSLLRLEAETVLVQLCLDAVAESLASAVDNLDRHERVQDLIAENPDTAGVLESCYQSLDPYTKGKETTAELWTAKTQEFWDKWGVHEVGSLIYCKRGHPYSRKAFQGCPECGGRKVYRKQNENGDEFVKNLDRGMFLTAMARMSYQR
ncbi:MAG: hypothetical protein Q9166_007834 [cf. Caloplaca sp. 2 TL-2023]